MYIDQRKNFYFWSTHPRLFLFLLRADLDVTDHEVRVFFAERPNKFLKDFFDSGCDFNLFASSFFESMFVRYKSLDLSLTESFRMVLHQLLLDSFIKRPELVIQNWTSNLMLLIIETKYVIGRVLTSIEDELKENVAHGDGDWDAWKMVQTSLRKKWSLLKRQDMKLFKQEAKTQILSYVSSHPTNANEG